MSEPEAKTPVVVETPSPPKRPPGPTVPGLIDIFSEKTSYSGNGGGIGDLILLAALLPGIQSRVPKHTLRVIANRKDWLELVYSGLIVNWNEYNESGVVGEKKILHFSDWWCKYDMEGEKLNLTRHEYFARRFNVKYELPIVKVRLDALTWARKELEQPLKDGKKIIGLFPFSTSKQREWPERHWVQLIDDIQRAGHVPIMVAGPEDDKRSEHFPCFRYWGLNALKTTALFSLMDLGIGNDSGMAHVNAALGRPTIVIGSATDVKRVFGSYKDVIAIQCEGACTACLWTKERGYRHSCTYGCDLMNDLKPKAVMEEIQKRLG